MPNRSPEFCQGDEVILVSPDGAYLPDGPVRVLGCISFDPQTEVAAYVVEHENGRREPVDGVELVMLDAWAEWMRANAN